MQEIFDFLDYVFGDLVQFNRDLVIVDLIVVSFDKLWDEIR